LMMFVDLWRMIVWFSGDGQTRLDFLEMRCWNGDYTNSNAYPGPHVNHFTSVQWDLSAGPPKNLPWTIGLLKHVYCKSFNVVQPIVGKTR
jgi:hypothetical protein